MYLYVKYSAIRREKENREKDYTLYSIFSVITKIVSINFKMHWYKPNYNIQLEQFDIKHL